MTEAYLTLQCSGCKETYKIGVDAVITSSGEFASQHPVVSGSPAAPSPDLVAHMDLERAMQLRPDAWRDIDEANRQNAARIRARRQLQWKCERCDTLQGYPQEVSDSTKNSDSIVDDDPNTIVTTGYKIIKSGDRPPDAPTGSTVNLSICQYCRQPRPVILSYFVMQRGAEEIEISVPRCATCDIQARRSFGSYGGFCLKCGAILGLALWLLGCVIVFINRRSDITVQFLLFDLLLPALGIGILIGMWFVCQFIAESMAWDVIRWEEGKSNASPSPRVIRWVADWRKDGHFIFLDYQPYLRAARKGYTFKAWREHLQ